MRNDLISQLLSLAEAYALEHYGCGLDRLDPSEVEYYAERVTEANLEEYVWDLAGAAWQAY